MEKFAFLQDQLDALQAEDLLRTLRCIRSAPGPTAMVDGDSRGKVNFCSNNYLNIAADPHVAQAVSQAVRQWGYGASASRLICGTMGPHVEVEERFAAFVGKEACIMFPSGWMANEAVLRTIPQKGDLVLMDKADHASIIDAAKAGEATFRTWRRDNPDRLRKLLAGGDYRRRFIVTESVFPWTATQPTLSCWSS
ncbi:MAG: pyridoxal phosphate-dependent aminotransferase family protein [Planctomycetes bacterium]|nr:pyridoxal phosphate-dependent aminotransferase family protein [Planctomycetota bacterium]